jgi:hypothetical protein
MPGRGGVAQPASRSSRSSTRAWRESAGNSARRSANGSWCAAAASSSISPSMMKPVTEFPTERQNRTGSRVCTGSPVSSKLASRYGVLFRPSVANTSPNELVENIASAARVAMWASGPGSCDSAAPSSGSLDSAIDCERTRIRAPVTAPPRTAASTRAL